ncbi:hypothetical protein [Dactylosporangium sp. CS-033363]|uniref:hypothetical protein n=1 Tax=Dactylosporangium sp. CS-033363 TaxID=3239935 RepID=UPI003D90796F
MTDDDATRDGLPRFIYGEYTGEFKMPPPPEEDEPADGKMDRKTMILVGSGGLALLFIIGLVVAALQTGGPDITPAAANPESPAASTAVSAAPTTAEAEPTQSWPKLTVTEIPGGGATTTKPGATKTANPGGTTKPPVETTKPDTKPTTRKPPTKPSIPGPR